MKTQRVICLLFASSLIATPQSNGGKVVRDKTNACQVSLPSDWKPGVSPGTANAPADQGDLVITSQPGKTLKPLSETTQKALLVDRVIQNTSQMILYSYAPTKSSNPITVYHIMAPGKGGTCSVLLSARKGVTEDQVKKIAATLAPAN